MHDLCHSLKACYMEEKSNDVFSDMPHLFHDVVTASAYDTRPSQSEVVPIVSSRLRPYLPWFTFSPSLDLCAFLNFNVWRVLQRANQNQSHSQPISSGGVEGGLLRFRHPSKLTSALRHFLRTNYIQGRTSLHNSNCPS